MSRKIRIPSYRAHRPSGRAVVTIAGRDIYLGAHGSTESHAEYQRLIAEYLASGGAPRIAPGESVTVNELVDQYLVFAENYYQRDGRPVAQLERIQRSLSIAIALYGPLPAAEFSPLRLQTVRAEMVRRGWTRIHVNHCVGCVVRAWKWAAAQEFVPPATYQGLRTVEGLRAGRTDAPEGEKVKPVPEKDLEATLNHAGRVLRSMIELQLATGMRPGELVTIRPVDIDRGGRADLGYGEIELPGVWVYRPEQHKTRHHGHERIILIGPRGQAALAPFLFRDTGKPCFSPREAIQERGWKLSRRGKAYGPRDSYSVGTYTGAIKFACARAKCQPWHAHRLRHNAASRLVQEFGWSVARILLGHRSVEVTRIYAEDSLTQAAEAARKSG